MEFLFNQGFDGLNNFILTNTGHGSTFSSQEDGQPKSQPWCWQKVQVSGVYIKHVYIL